jgi:murein L,D-transpeptidase YafK
MRFFKPLLGFLPAILCAPFVWSNPVPSSPRSLEVVARATPVLTPALRTQGLELGSPVFFRLFKETSELEAWVKGQDGYRHFKTYDICFYSGKLGPKLRAGDLQGPEGFYAVGPQQLLPSSRFHVGLLLDYPNRYDRSLGRTGGAIVIHGDCVSIGCYAMTDPRIEEIYTLADAALRGGQKAIPVHIFPFRMTEGNLVRFGAGSSGIGQAFGWGGSPARGLAQWASFWRNLKEGYDLFEADLVPPQVSVKDGRYRFRSGV